MPQGMTSEPLVPRGLPYGERQNIEEAMRLAGVPRSAPTAGTPGAAVSSPVARHSAGGSGDPGVDLLMQTTPDDFPFLADPARQTPAAQPTSQPDSAIQALATSSQSSFGAAVLSRLNRR